VQVLVLLSGVDGLNTLIFIIVAPMLGMGLGFGMMALLMWLFHKHPSSKINGILENYSLFLQLSIVLGMVRTMLKRRWVLSQ